MALFGSLVSADLSNTEKLDRMIPKIVLGAKLDTANLWGVCNPYTLTPEQDKGAERIRHALQAVFMEVIRRAAQKYSGYFYDGNKQIGFRAGEDPTLEISAYLGPWRRRDWYAIISTSRIYLGQCVVCGSQDYIRLPSLEEYVSDMAQLSDSYTLHKPCKDKAICFHCEEKIITEDVKIWLQWSVHKLCTTCNDTAQPMIRQVIPRTDRGTVPFSLWKNRVRRFKA